MAVRKDLVLSMPPVGPDDEPGSPASDAFLAWLEELTDEEVQYLLEQDGIDVDASWERCKAKIKERLGLDLDEEPPR